MPDAAAARADLTKVERDFDFLLTCFREVLEEAGDGDVASRLWFSGAPAAEMPGPSDRTAQAHAIAFQLLNMAEENAAAQQRRAMEVERGLAYEPGLWGGVLERMKARGCGGPQIAETLQTVRVEPVLTAHPTEAKRATVLEHHRGLIVLPIVAGAVGLLVRRVRSAPRPRPSAPPPGTGRARADADSPDQGAKVT